MSKWKSKLETVIARQALAVTSASVNSICLFLMHQPKLPKDAESLRHK